ncbi:membrane integrity-associated transporter subunit PqiC [Amaricoccus sp.]|uniref:PqiC family protein n=1 Tax=Amaricoccus sp. TaxID=1872485 RepID=UPI001B48E909|nr:PqiC family protein [Amaricoccus sp.]MBP7000665.1 membrane integrity-associated transporter subunit PqiC [Amaricoccus sp.]
MRRSLLLLLAALGLAACAGKPDYYLVPPVGGASRQGSAGSVAVADMSLPAYAETVEIAVMNDTGAVTLSKGALWADTPRRALTRHLVAALQSRLAAQVATEPWPAFDQPDLRVEVFVDRMIGAPDGPFQFSGQYVIVSNLSGRVISSDRFAITLPPQGAGYQGLIDAHARAVEALADQIAARLSRGGYS